MSFQWFERADLLEGISKRVQGFCAGYRQNLALMGPQGSGKTTLLRRYLQERLPRDAGLLPVYLEAAEDDHLAECAARFVRAILYGILQGTGNPDLPASISGLLEASRPAVPQTAGLAGQVLALAEGRRPDEAYELMWDLPALASQETGHRVLLVLEEFHRLRALPVREPFRALGRKIMVQSSTMFLLTSSNPEVARSILHEGLSLLFGKFETLEMPSLTGPDCRRAMREVSGSVQDPLLEQILVGLAQGRADRLHLLLGVLQKHRLPGLATEQAVGDLLEELFLEPASLLRREFELQLRSLPTHPVRALCIEVLGAVASGLHRLPQISDAVGRSRSETLRALRILTEPALLSRHGVFYHLQDRLFALWMSTAQPALQGEGCVGSPQAARRFREAAGRWVRQMREASARSLEERLEELIGQWRGEWAELEGRRTQLPKLAEIRRISAPFPFGGVVARRSAGGKGGWCVVLWTRTLEEAQAGQLVQLLRAQRLWAGYRKVVLATQRAELNARLVLQGERIRLWDQHVVNGLMELYGLLPIPLAESAESAGSQHPQPGWAESVRLTDRPPMTQHAGGAGDISIGGAG